MGLRENMKKNFILTLRELKNYDVQDQLKKRVEGQQEGISLKGVAEFSTAGPDGTLTLDYDKLYSVRLLFYL